MKYFTRNFGQFSMAFGQKVSGDKSFLSLFKYRIRKLDKSKYEQFLAIDKKFVKATFLLAKEIPKVDLKTYFPVKSNLSNSFSKCVVFTKFLPKRCESKFP